MKCRLCQRPSESEAGFCRYHGRAKVALEEAYKVWKNAYGELTWAQYLDKIIKNQETGQWASEVAKLMEKGESGD